MKHTNIKERERNWRGGSSICWGAEDKGVDERWRTWEKFGLKGKLWCNDTISVSERHDVRNYLM